MLLEGRLGLGNHTGQAWCHCMAEAGAVGGGWDGLDLSRRHSRQVGRVTPLIRCLALRPREHVICIQPDSMLSAISPVLKNQMPMLDSMEDSVQASDAARLEMVTLAGIDMSLAFIARQNGEDAAKTVATYLEYTGDYRLQLLLHMPKMIGPYVQHFR